MAAGAVLMSDPADRRQVVARQDAWLRLHTLIYVLMAGILMIVDKATGPAPWAFWPLIAWGSVLAVHFFIVRSLSVDEDWANERAQELHDKSYDFGHIDDIRGRIETSDPTVSRDGEERPLKRPRRKT